MANIGNKIRSMRKNRGWTQEQLADMIGKKRSAIGNYEQDIREPDLDTVESLADVFRVPISFLIGSEQLPDSITTIGAMHHHRVPLIGSVALGEPILAEQEYDVYVDSPIQADYALRTEGDSMSPTYLDGDIVYIRALDAVADGTVAVVLIDDSATLKHVYQQPDGIMLTGDNPSFVPMQVKFDEHDVIRILGVPVGYTRMYKKGKRQGRVRTPNG